MTGMVKFFSKNELMMSAKRLTIIGIVMAAAVVYFGLFNDVFYEKNARPFYDSAYKIWAHRGAVDVSRAMVENSIASIDAAATQGAKGVEIDVFYDPGSSQFIVSHDKPYQLHDEKYLMLGDVLARFGPRFYYWLDFKNLASLPTDEALKSANILVKLLREFGVLEFAIVESVSARHLMIFSEKGVKTLYSIFVDPQLAAYNYWYKLFKIRYEILRYDQLSISVNYREFNQQLISRLPPVDFYLATVNDRATIDELGRHKSVRVILSDVNYYDMNW